MRASMGRGLFVFVVLAAIWTGLVAAADQAPPLSIEQRVAAQKAIEEVFWRHRIWPEGNSSPKPGLDGALSEAAIREKVLDGLRQSAALERFWSHPLTTADLEQEMLRMARGSKAPDVLAELHAALGNDPRLIAEALARPALSGRLVRSWYARDSRFHGELRHRAEAALAGSAGNVAALRPLADRYEEVEWVRGENPSPEARESAPPHRLEMTEEIWTASREWLVRLFDLEPAAVTALPIGTLSRLQEDDQRFFVVAVIGETNGRLNVASVSWDKTPFSDWWSEARPELQADPALAPGPEPQVAASAASAECRFDGWTGLPELPVGRRSHVAVWTGTEMLVWGGYGSPGYLDSGHRYNAATDTWVPMNRSGAPLARDGHAVVWTGTEMIVWGGYNSSYGALNTGGRYDPRTDTWRPTTLVNVPSSRYSHTAVWTGSEMIVWGGDWYLNSGGRYDPISDVWTSMPGAPNGGRHVHTAVWTGSEMIVWGGYNCRSDGDRFNPTTNTWQGFYGSGNPGGRYRHVTVWTGQRMIVWGGDCAGANGGQYNPTTDTWTQINPSNAPTNNYRELPAVWTGSEMLVWSGYPYQDQQGGRYDPVTNTWRRMTTFGAPGGRYQHTGVWTGGELIVWGGASYQNTGGRYSPASDTWIPTSLDAQPSPRQSHTAVWTGSEMIVWGGYPYASDGSRYIPASDLWEPTSYTTLTPRADHTALWTGTEMIVWGGNYYDTRLAEGARYDPFLDTWTPVATAGAPRARTWHTAIWTGSRMIVWGGHGDRLLNNGGQYDPIANAWSPTDATTAPTSRAHHTAIWTGAEMIVWGGDTTSPSGGRYDPDTNTWVPTSIAGAPSPRQLHTAVWSGNQMLVWGGAGGGVNTATGGIYDPASDTWTSMSTAGPPAARSRHVSVWADRVMLVWGGYDGANELATGGKYIPGVDLWQPIGSAGAPGRRADSAAIWNGREMYLWGGYDATSTATGGFLNNGSRYCACNATDATCDGIDQDCDGLADDGYPVGATACGVGACASTGESTCIGGMATDTCVPGQPAPDDTACNAVDDDCDGATDEEYAIQPTACGVGACFSTGATSCVAGSVQDSCAAGVPAPADPTCNGIDDDCDGGNDEEYLSLNTTCGVGACSSTGVTSCVGGTVQDSCVPHPPAPIDNTCNGIDDDCNGSVDEDFSPQTISCGVGICRRNGTTACVGGQLSTDCTPGAPAAADATCDGLDDDCNGVADEDYAPQPTSCGLGACYRTGQTSCVAGAVVNGCVPGAPAPYDGLCNGIDDDCDGLTDEEFVSQPTSCGVGACLRTGTIGCVNGSLHTDCSPGQPSPELCANGLDDDCDGLTDGADPECGSPLCPDIDGDGMCSTPCVTPDGSPCNDCNDSDPTVWLVPGEVLAVRLERGGGVTDIRWTGPMAPGGTVVLFDVVRSIRADAFDIDAVCVETGSADLASQDAEDPEARQAFFFLVRATNSCVGGAGTFGTRSDGTLRLGRACP